MGVTRIILSGLLIAAVGVGVGCDPATGPMNQRIELGDAEQFREHGIYDDYKESHDLLLVSRRAAGSETDIGTMLVALDARCPHDGADVVLNERTNLLHCTRCDSRWTKDGVIQSGSLAESSLDRYRIGLTGTRIAKERRPYIDLSERFRQRYMKTVGSRTFEVQEWSSLDSMYMYELDARIADDRDDDIDDRVQTAAERR